ncbi:PREDICTED: uncharacterized protein LOC105460252 isoform X2 [Wasmannia auropunctata]|uniref:uncharacterized protein LOC105460252 isoform X2 n=1 Tax=Wasmannia auropunctata TaxID=64793 RepID=UPI0005F0B9F0|nr:PREDICTED: uncharacterized protein LOC105460252 isoform X2 [Wasmannia auropunctata]
MDLRNDIKKATSLGSIEDDAKFYRLHGLSQAAKDKKMNERKVKKPRNANLVENFDTENDDYMNSNINSKVKPTFDKHDVSAAVREVNGGRDLSNKCWEETYSKNLNRMETQSKNETSQNSSKHDKETENLPKAKNLNDKYIKQKDKWYRNAAIMGLVKAKKISMQDLINSSDENSARNEDGPDTLHGTAFNGCITDCDKNQVESVPLREDPEIFVHPLQMGLDKKQFKHIDFSIPRIGKKKKMTPLEFFLEADDDDFFEFVKNKE